MTPSSTTIEHRSQDDQEHGDHHIYQQNAEVQLLPEWSGEVCGRADIPERLILTGQHRHHGQPDRSGRHPLYAPVGTTDGQRQVWRLEHARREQRHLELLARCPCSVTVLHNPCRCLPPYIEVPPLGIQFWHHHDMVLRMGHLKNQADGVSDRQLGTVRDKGDSDVRESSVLSKDSARRSRGQHGCDGQRQPCPQATEVSGARAPPHHRTCLRSRSLKNAASAGT